MPPMLKTMPPQNNNMPQGVAHATIRGFKGTTEEALAMLDAGKHKEPHVMEGTFRECDIAYLRENVKALGAEAVALDAHVFTEAGKTSLHIHLAKMF